MQSMPTLEGHFRAILTVQQLITRGDIKVFLPPIGMYCLVKLRDMTQYLTACRWLDGLLLRRSRQYVRSQQEARAPHPRRGKTSQIQRRASAEISNET